LRPEIFDDFADSYLFVVAGDQDGEFRFLFHDSGNSTYY
jgi:hypothetical protein